MTAYAKNKTNDPVSLWGQVIEGFQLTNKNLHQEIAESFSLDPAEAEVLLRLNTSSDQRMAMAELAREVAFTTGGFTKVADRLVKRDLVRRAPCEDDRRVTYLDLTDSGRRTARALRRHVNKIITATFIDVLGTERSAMVAQAMADLHQSSGTD